MDGPEFNHPVSELTDEEDEETLAAIDRGVDDADHDRVISLEEARDRILSRDVRKPVEIFSSGTC